MISARETHEQADLCHPSCGPAAAVPLDAPRCAAAASQVYVTEHGTWPHALTAGDGEAVALGAERQQVLGLLSGLPAGPVRLLVQRAHEAARAVQHALVRVPLLQVPAQLVRAVAHRHQHDMTREVAALGEADGVDPCLEVAVDALRARRGGHAAVEQGGTVHFALMRRRAATAATAHKVVADGEDDGAVARLLWRGLPRGAADGLLEAFQVHALWVGGFGGKRIAVRRGLVSV